MMRSLVLLLTLALHLFTKDASVEEIASWIGNAKQSLLEEEAKNGLREDEIRFVTFWNFDETILDGDSTEGSKGLYGNVIFKGLAQVAIESGFSKKYPAFPKFWDDYKAMEEVDAPKAYAYAAQMLAGAQEKRVLEMATQYFKATLRPHLFQASVDLIRILQRENIQVLILTASPRIFVQGAGPLLNIPLADIYGMETVSNNGILTDQMVLPLTTGQGKIEKIKEIVQEKLGRHKKVYVLAGFGNYNVNDMPFLEWIASQKFPAGKPLAAIDYQPPRISGKNMALFRLTREVK